MAKPFYAMDPFYMSECSDADSDDSTLEPIDEQEVYGKVSDSPNFIEHLLRIALTPVSDFMFFGVCNVSRIYLSFNAGLQMGWTLTISLFSDSSWLKLVVGC